MWLGYVKLLEVNLVGALNVIHIFSFSHPNCQVRLPKRSVCIVRHLEQNFKSCLSQFFGGSLLTWICADLSLFPCEVSTVESSVLSRRILSIFPRTTKLERNVKSFTYYIVVLWRSVNCQTLSWALHKIATTRSESIIVQVVWKEAGLVLAKVLT